jgi:hypothetical protein
VVVDRDRMGASALLILRVDDPLEARLPRPVTLKNR